MDKVKIHKGICDNVHETFKAKDADYGGAYTETRKEFDNAVLFFLTVKLKRLKQLMKGNKPNVEESIEDTLLDMADYCIMELTERRMDKLSTERKKDVVNCTLSSAKLIKKMRKLQNLFEEEANSLMVKSIIQEHAALCDEVNETDEEVQKHGCSASCENVNKADEEGHCKYQAEHFWENK